MSKVQIRGSLSRNGVSRFLTLLAGGVLLFTLSACGMSGPSGNGSSVPTPNPAVQFRVTSVDLAVSPASIAGTVCGSPATFAYTLNNGRSQTPASVSARAGQTSETFTFVSSGTLLEDHTYPGPAIVMATSPNTALSPAVLPGGACTVQGPFEVTAVTITVNPTSIADMACGTPVTVTYTATFTRLPTALWARSNSTTASTMDVAAHRRASPLHLARRPPLTSFSGRALSPPIISTPSLEESSCIARTRSYLSLWARAAYAVKSTAERRRPAVAFLVLAVPNSNASAALLESAAANVHGVCPATTKEACDGQRPLQR